MKSPSKKQGIVNIKFESKLEQIEEKAVEETPRLDEGEKSKKPFLFRKSSSSSKR
jgi:hypothetical protein